jgi:hypothetical protein
VLNEVRAALAAAQAAQVTAQPTTPTLIPKPRGTSGRGNFNLANAMGVDTTVCHGIQACILPRFSTLILIVSTGFRSFTREYVGPRQKCVMEEPARG